MVTEIFYVGMYNYCVFILSCTLSWMIFNIGFGILNVNFKSGNRLIVSSGIISISNYYYYYYFWQVSPSVYFQVSTFRWGIFYLKWGVIIKHISCRSSWYLGSWLLILDLFVIFILIYISLLSSFWYLRFKLLVLGFICYCRSYSYWFVIICII